jgi:hypothetical protein
MKSVHWILITLLLVISAHAEVKTSLPDFNQIKTESLRPIDITHHVTAPVPTKSKTAVDEQLSLAVAFDYGVTLATPPVQYLSKRLFLQKNQAYRSYYEQPFYLLI